MSDTTKLPTVEVCVAGPCKVCVEKSEEIRDILRPFGLSHVEPVGGVQILADSFKHAQRIVAALESIGVNLDEEDIVALELFAADPNSAYRMERIEFRQDFNARTGFVQEDTREREQERAVEASSVGEAYGGG